MSKYSAKRIDFDGFLFDSLAECRRYRELKLLEQAGLITGLIVHPSFILQPPFKHHGRSERAIRYEADFSYFEKGAEVVEDVKGVRTQLFEVKRKMLLYRFPDLDFRIVEA